jgi:hypothetical protein
MGTSTLTEGLLPPAFDDPRGSESRKIGRSSENREEGSSGLDSGPDKFVKPVASGPT